MGKAARNRRLRKLRHEQMGPKKGLPQTLPHIHGARDEDVLVCKAHEKRVLYYSKRVILHRNDNTDCGSLELKMGKVKLTRMLEVIADPEPPTPTQEEIDQAKAIAGVE